MSRKPGKSHDDSSKIRKELKKLKVEINQLKKASKSIYILTGNDKQKLVLNIQENLKHNIYSPPKVQRSRSPLLSKPKKNCRNTTQNSRKNSVLPENKENCPSSRDIEFLSPQFANNKELIREENDELKCFGQFAGTVLEENHESTNNTTETLQNENNMLKILNNLKIENEKLRSQIKLGKTVFSKDKLKKKHSKNKVSFLDINENSQNLNHNEDKNEPQPSVNLSRKSQKILKNSRRRSTNHVDPAIISIKFRSPSEILRSPKDIMSNIFLFPESTMHKKKQSRVLSTSFSKSVSKSPTSVSIGNLDISITPKGQSCKNCDYLLFRGRPTKSCSDHNYKIS